MSLFHLEHYINKKCFSDDYGLLKHFQCFCHEIRSNIILSRLCYLGQTKLMSWSSDLLTLIIQNQNFNKKNISDDQSQKCSCPTTCSFLVSGQNGPWTKTASTKTASTETAPYQNGLYPKRPLTETASTQNGL